MQRDYYVYVHKRMSDNEIFYIGKGTGQRCKEHTERPLEWQEMATEHGWYYELLHTNLTSKQAESIERLLINEHKDSTYLTNKTWSKARKSNNTGILGVSYEEKTRLKLRKRTGEYVEETYRCVTAHVYDVDKRKQLKKSWSTKDIGYDKAIEIAKQWRKDKLKEILDKQQQNEYITFDYLANKDADGNILLYKPDGTFLEKITIN